ncbi:uncharacterized protein BJ171DRAFT_408263, partial [Polychytrium aggregatum]|uniref:uncharacterized protein n=1 Tax=Polychytrium aggregatum TaxID=110093 RepID=UPI0022FDD27E
RTSKPTNATTHLQRHTFNDTPSFRFARSHDLTRHIQTHTRERPHVCPRCHRQFARRDALRRHERVDAQGGKHC